MILPQTFKQQMLVSGSKEVAKWTMEVVSATREVTKRTAELVSGSKEVTKRTAEVVSRVWKLFLQLREQ